MKFNVDIVLKNLQGETLKDTDSKEIGRAHV